MPLYHLDFNRCRASILRYSPWEWVAATSADELVQCTPENVCSLGYIWVGGGESKTATKWVSKLPWQSERFYHQSAVRWMLSAGTVTYRDLSVGCSVFA